MKRWMAYLCGLVIVGLAASTSLAEVHFRDLTFAAAKKQAKVEKKKIMIDFYTDWCGWCKVLDRKTYPDSAVGAVADAEFIPLKINAEKGEGVDLAKQFKVTGYPTIVFLSDDGQEIDRVVGYEDAGHFVRSLKLASNGGTKALLEEIESGKTVTDPQKYLVAAEYYEGKEDATSAQKYFQKVVDLDPDNARGLKAEATYHLAFLSKGPEMWGLLESAVKAYPMRAEGQQATLALIQHGFKAEKAEDAERAADFWIARHPDDGQVLNYFAWMAAESGKFLPKAETYAEHAISLATGDEERAGVMDTKAEVLYKMQRYDDAIAVEKQAIGLSAKDSRMVADLQKQLAKFESAKTGGTASAAH